MCRVYCEDSTDLPSYLDITFLHATCESAPQFSDRKCRSCRGSSVKPSHPSKTSLNLLRNGNSCGVAPRAVRGKVLSYASMRWLCCLGKLFSGLSPPEEIFTDRNSLVTTKQTIFHIIRKGMGDSTQRAWGASALASSQPQR